MDCMQLHTYITLFQCICTHILFYIGFFGEGPADRRARLRNLLATLGMILYVTVRHGANLTVSSCGHPQRNWELKLIEKRRSHSQCSELPQRFVDR